jgi:hypothetical protein
MSATQRPSPGGSEERQYKRKKLSSACLACAKRKSRCELMTAAGCLRCRTLRTSCSRVNGVWADHDGRDDSPLAYGPGNEAGPSGSGIRAGGQESDGPAREGMLYEIHMRSRRMERMLGGIMGHLAKGTVGPVSTLRPYRPDSEGRPASAQTVGTAADIANRALDLHRPLRCRDPVDAGLISLADWSCTYNECARFHSQMKPS